jgi:hypothetical protein
MAITLNTSPEEEELILQRAAKAKLTPEQYLLKLAVGSTEKRASSNKQLTPPPTWGARVLAELKVEGVLEGYGDPSIDSPELARQLRERFSNRNSE